MHQNILAVLKGFSVFIVASIIAFNILLADESANIGLIFWPSLMLAGLVTAMTAQSFRFVFAIALSIPCAIGFGLENMAWGHWYANADVFAAEDFILVVLTTLPYNLALCGLGGATGWGLHMLRSTSMLHKIIPSFLHIR